MKPINFTDYAEYRLAITVQDLSDAIETKASNVRVICGIAMDLMNSALNWAKELCKTEVSKIMEF